MKTSMRHRNISTAPSSSRDHLAAESRVHSEHAVVITGLKLISLQNIDQTEAEGALTKIETCEEVFLRTLTHARPASFKETTRDMTSAIRHSTDEELVIAAQKGILHALNELLTRHRSLVYQTVRRLASTAEETDDVVQEAMLRAFTNIGKFRHKSAFSLWLIVIAVNSALSFRRESRRAQWMYLDDMEEPYRGWHNSALQDTRPTPERECICRDLQRLIQCEIRKLLRSYRSVLETRDLDETSIKQAAQALGISVPAFKGRLWRARSILSRALKL
jgi:RNA polymerase sigma-70 factor (ECF subfamily)